MPDDFTAEPAPWPAEPTTIQAEASGLPASRLDIEWKRPRPWNFRLIGKLPGTDDCAGGHSTGHLGFHFRQNDLRTGEHKSGDDLHCY